MTAPPLSPETPDVLPPSAPTPPIETTPATWPRLLPGIDRFILLLLLIVAGMTAAHVARNSDLWLHLATGRDLVSGKYHLGSDPYSTTGADRTWVNHAWLTDLVSYQIYKASTSGDLLVLAKALVFAGAFAMVLRLRKPGTSGWPWCVALVLGIVAAAPHSGLRPMILSAFFVAVTLWILIGLPWKCACYRKPILLAALFALWANLDAWFLLGPVMVLFTLLGELLQRQLFGKGADGEAPAVPDLVKALLIGTLATLVNPHHIGVWQLPAELGVTLPESVKSDATLKFLKLSPVSSDYMDSANFGKNANGLAFAALFVGGGVLLALGFARVRLAMLFLWMLFAGLALLQYRMILFFAIAAVPLAAIALGELVDRVKLGAANDQNTRLKILLASILRPALLVIAIAAGVCAWPGWIHPKPGDPANTNRVALGVEADAGYERAAKLVQEWRTSRVYGDEDRGLYLSLELANYIAWFAPSERVTMNTRLPFHLPETAAIIEARRAYVDPNPEAVEKLRASLQTFKANTLLYAGTPHRAIELPSIVRLVLSEKPMTLVHLDGRSAVLSTSGNSGFSFDPKRMAFRNRESADEMLDVLAPAPPRLPPGDVDDFLQAPRVIPLASLDATVWREYASFLVERRNSEYQNGFVMTSLAMAGPGPVYVLRGRNQVPLPPAPDNAIAANLLAIRAARQAIALNPDAPQAYYALGMAYMSKLCPMPGIDANAQGQMAAAFRRYLDRAPLPAEITVPVDAKNAEVAAESLADYYKSMGAIDLYRETNKLAVEYYLRFLAFVPIKSEDEAKAYKAESEKLQKELGELDKRYSAMFERYQSQTNGRPLKFRINAAQQAGFIGEAIKLIGTADLDKELGTDARAMEVLGVQLRAQTGQVEAAAEAFRVLQAKVLAMADSPDATTRQIGFQLSRALAELIVPIQSLAGNDAEVAAYVQKNGIPSPLSAVQKAAVQDAVQTPETLASLAEGRRAQAYGALGGIPAFAVQREFEITSMQQWQTQSQVYTNLGVLTVLAGKNADARRWFEIALQPDGIPVPEFLVPQRAVADRYLKLMAK